MSSSLADVGIKKNIKLVTVPLAKNKLLIRLVNMFDQFDGSSVDPDECYINETGLVTALFNSVNLEGDYAYSLKELSLSGNMPIEEVEDRKINWKTVDDWRVDIEAKFKMDDKEGMITLEPMRIRVFQLEYHIDYQDKVSDKDIKQAIHDKLDKL